VYWVTLGLLFAAFVGLLVGFFLTFGSVRIISTTMAPTLQPNDVAIYQRGASGIVRGDVVIVQVPGGGGGVLPRRVIGLPGDRVTCCTTGGQVTVDGKALAEDYLTPGPTTKYSTMPLSKIVPQGNVWVMGDNRADAADSREWGPLPTSAIVGRVVLATGPGASRTLLRTPATFTVNGLAPADNRVPLPLLLILLAVVAALATAVEGTVGLIVWLVRRSRRQRVQQPQPMAW
jgi:signal peptidase I